MKKTSISALIDYFHPAGRPFMGLFGGVTILLGFMDCTLFWLGVLLTAWCFYFFRDPERTVPTRAGLIVSPADGKVVGVSQVAPPPEMNLGNDERWRVSIFLNVFDVHVNRMPAEGTVASCSYRKGLFVNASFDKASEDNERMTVVLTLSGEHPRAGQTLGVVQIAGLIARRIVCDAKPNDRFETGARYGIIRFGSRVDLYLPAGLPPLVSVGQYMIGGETVIADCLSNEGPRPGEVC